MRELGRRLVCTTTMALAVLACGAEGASFGSEVIVSVPDQELALILHGKLVACYPVSTSTFGIGDTLGSYRTPLGESMSAGSSAMVFLLVQ